MSDIKTGVELIAAERQRQIEVEGWTVEHDAEHKEGEISMAAGSYLAHSLSRYREERHHTNQSPLADFKVYDFGERMLSSMARLGIAETGGCAHQVGAIVGRGILNGGNRPMIP